MPSWKKVILSGSDAALHSLNVSTAFTASGLHYPTADNGALSFLQTDGSGNLSFQYVNATIDTVYNGESTTIVKGTPVYVSGSQGANPKVYRADASNPLKMPVVYIAADNISTASTGRGIILGQIDGVNTTGYPANTEIYAAPGGGWTSTRPTGSAIVQVLGIVTKEGSGGKGLVLNPGPANLPNIASGNVWVGNSNSYPTAVPTSSLIVASASYALTASYIEGGVNPFPYTGSAQITGSLEVTGSINGLQLGLGAGSVDTNIAIGSQVLMNNTTGNHNIAQGFTTLYSNIDGTDNIAQGYAALYTNTTGYNNIAQGYTTLYSNTTGFNNLAQGYQSLTSNTTGYNNIAIGGFTLSNNTIGYSNIAQGYQALQNNTTGYFNIAQGYQALQNNSIGFYNNAQGYKALQFNTTGSNNIAIGPQALYLNTTGSVNTAIGPAALYSNTTGSYNIALGQEALFNNRVGFYNVAQGYQTLRTNISGSTNIAIGYRAGYYASGSSTSNVYIGTGAGPVTNTSENAKLYIASGSGTPLIGGNFIAKTVTISGSLEVKGLITGSLPLVAGPNITINKVGNDYEISGSNGGASGVTQIDTAGSVNGITLTGGPITTTGTITLGGTLSGIENSQLTNSSITIGSTSISLGSSATTIAGLSSVTSTTFVGALSGNASTATSASYASTAATATSATSAGSVTNAVTFNSGGSGDASGTSFNGSAARTISYNTIGAQPLLTNPVTGTGVNQRVALWSGTTTQTSNANLTFDGTTLAVGGNATTTGYAIIGTHAYLASGNYIYFDSGVTNDYAIRKTGTSLAFTSAGNFTFNKPVTITGTAEVLKIESSNTNLYQTFKANGTEVGYVGNGVGTISGGSATDFGFQSLNNTIFATGGGTERVRITSAGNLLVNKTSSSYKLHVVGGQYGTLLRGGDLGTGSDILRLTDASDNTKYLARGDGKHFFTGDTDVQGLFTATVKSFIIDHPTKPTKKLQYGVLEGPEHSVYVRGKLTNNNIITLPDHWHALVHEDTITINLTPIGKRQDLWVETVSDTVITVGSDSDINCFYTVFAERKDIEKLVTEFDKE